MIFYFSDIYFNDHISKTDLERSVCSHADMSKYTVNNLVQSAPAVVKKSYHCATAAEAKKKVRAFEMSG